MHLLTEGCKSASDPGCESAGPCTASLDTRLGAIPCPLGHGHFHSSKEVRGPQVTSKCQTAPRAAGDSQGRQDVQTLHSAGLKQHPQKPQLGCSCESQPQDTGCSELWVSSFLGTVNFALML